LFSFFVVIATTPLCSWELLSFGQFVAHFASPGLGVQCMVQLVEEKVNINVYSSRHTYTINVNVREIKLLGEMVVLDIQRSIG
jgi:hypothetical protein